MKANIDIEYSQKMGRYARAKSDIKAGDIVLVEEPHCALLLDTYRETHCHNCFKRYIKSIIYCAKLPIQIKYFLF